MKGKKGGTVKRGRKWKESSRRCEKGQREKREKEKGMRREKGDRWQCLSGLLPLRQRRTGWVPL